MSDVPTSEATDTTPAPDRPWWQRRALAGAAPRDTHSIATYYRLRSALLGARVAALEAELEQTERQLQATIDRYEQLLARPDEEWVVSTPHGPDVMMSPDGD
mgnify:FL=1